MSRLFFAPTAEEISQGHVRMFRISYQWKRYGKVFKASTLWNIKGDAAAALSNFTARNPHVFSARVEGEAL